ncbi:MAG: hypothetical protein ACE5HB_02595 [Terriglobia bacterium]
MAQADTRKTNGKALRLKAAARRWRNIHLVTGLVVGVWLLLMTLTGVLVNHQVDWGLDEIEISNAYLPDHYTDEFHPDSTRLNVVLTDLHSGRFFGPGGRYLSDVIGLLVLISVGSGFYSYLLMRRANRLGMQSNGLAVVMTRRRPEPASRPLPLESQESEQAPEEQAIPVGGRRS